MMRNSFFLAIGLLILGFQPASSQCWNCETQYYPGDDCWMEGCWATFDEGAYNECGQQGSCDMETCDVGGGICNPHLASLDGRAPDRLPRSVLDLNDVPGVIASRASQVDMLLRECSGAVVHAFYTPHVAVEIRRRTERLTL